MMPSALVVHQFLFIPWLLPPILVISLVLLVLIFLNRSKPNKTSPKLPPSPPKLPIIGNLHQLGKLPHQSLCQLSGKYGPVMLLQLGSIPTLVISSAEMAKEILKTHDADFCSRADSPGARKLSYKYSDVAFSPYNDQWKERRKIFVSQLINSKKSRESLGKAREVAVDRLMESLSSFSSPNQIKFDEKMFELVGNIVSSVAFGKSYREYQFQGQELKDVFDEAMDMQDSFSAVDFFPSVGWIIDFVSGHQRRLNSCFAKLDAFLEMVLQEHLDLYRAKKTDKEDLVDILIGISNNNHSSFTLTREHIKGMLMNMFLGGVDTTAVTVVWAMTELLKNDRVMQKVQAEIRSTTGRKLKLNEEDVAKLDYLKMVLKETFRLHPPASYLIPHEARHHCKIGGEKGYDVCKKTRVVINAWAIGRDPNSWKNPNEFYPERFENSDIDFKGVHFELIPFGAGRRICPGLSMSTITVEFILANLLYFFDWKLPAGTAAEDISLEEEGGITIHKKVPLSLMPIRFIWQEQ